MRISLSGIPHSVRNDGAAHLVIPNGVRNPFFALTKPELLLSNSYAG